MATSGLFALPVPGDGLPSGLIDWLLQLIGGRSDGIWPIPDLWPPSEPPTLPLPSPPSVPLPNVPTLPSVPDEWKRWVQAAEKAKRELDAAGRAARDAAQTARNAYAAARLKALDVLVGLPCLKAADIFAKRGHADAALLLREFVHGHGQQLRTFPDGSPFSQGFARSETTTDAIARGLAAWKSRQGGLGAQNGTFTNGSATFVPVKLEETPPPVPMEVPGISVRVIGSPEAHVIGSFAYEGRLAGDAVAEWRATNTLSLKSYFAENWTRRINVSVVDNNYWPDPYGNTDQVILWRTTLDGQVLD